MSRNWDHIGPTTIMAFNGKVYNFDTFEAAIRWLGGDYIARMTEARLGSLWEYSSEHDKWRVRWYRERDWNARTYDRHLVPTYGTSHVLLDEMGLRIPVWRIKEAWANLPNLPSRKRRIYSWRRRHRSGRNSSGYHLRLREEVMVEEAGCEWLGHKIKRRASKIPDPWDDDYGRGNYGVRSWKEHRRTQHKET